MSDMSDLFAIASRALRERSGTAALTDAIDLTRSRQLKTVATKERLLAAAHRTDGPCGGARVYEDSRWACVFAGDLIGHKTVPFSRLIAALDTGRWDYLAGLRGVFAVAAYDQVNKRLFAVSDRRSQKPLFYMQDGEHVHIASNLAVFLRLIGTPKFEKTWLWQVLYFNFPVDGTTFVKGVKRMPPASVLVFNEGSAEVSIITYAESFMARRPLLGGQDGLRRAKEIFAERVPNYFHGAHEIACALTGGWDGRTMLAFAPARDAVTAYTYGRVDCGDLAGAWPTAKAVGIDHIEIPFDDSFVNDLPRHAVETVYLSGGLQGVLRCTLNYAYRTLTESGRRFPVAVSGISLGTQLRGHANVPSIVSKDLALLFRGQFKKNDFDQWHDILGHDYSQFADLVCGNLDKLEREYGAFESPEHHLSYALYKGSPEYFAGELAVADHYTTVRVPGWDCDVIECTYSIAQGMLSYSEFLPTHRRGCREEMVLQAYLLRELAPDIYRMNVRNNRPASVLGGEVLHRLEQYYQAIRRRVLKRSLSRNGPLEDWNVWLFDRHRLFVDDLLRGPETLVRDYIDPFFVARSILMRDRHMLGKLLTTEIILRLIKTRWKLFEADLASSSYRTWGINDFVPTGAQSI